MKFKENDGGRSKYFNADKVGDCVIRSIAIATGKDYKEVYNESANVIGYTPRNGVKHRDTKRLMEHFGGVWNALMKIGSGCKHHLSDNEVPMNGHIVCNVSKHCVAVIDGVINDTYDPSRGGKRCVYGYWRF